MSEHEIRQAFAMLIAAGHAEHNARWMSEACPSIDRCREICAEDSRRTLLEGSEDARAICEAHRALRDSLGTAQEQGAHDQLAALVERAKARRDALAEGKR